MYIVFVVFNCCFSTRRIIQIKAYLLLMCTFCSVYVIAMFDCCFTSNVMEDDKFRLYVWLLV